MKEFFERLRMPSPAFFVKLQRFGLLLSGVSALLLGLDSQFPAAKLPDVFEKIGGYLAIAGVIIAGVAKLTVSDVEELHRRVEK